MSPDLINGLFEFGGSLVGLKNLQAIRKDKKIAGIHWSPTVFFTSWGLWNLIYYPLLNQWWSFTGGIALVTINVLWLGHIIYYNYQNKKCKEHFKCNYI